MSSFKSRVLVAVIGVPVLVWVVLWAPSIVMMAALALLAGIAAHELMQCVGLDKTSFLLSWTMISAIFSVEWYYDRPSYIVVWWTIYVVTAFIYAIVKAGEVKFVQVLAGIFAVMFAFVMDRWFGGSIGYGPMAFLALVCSVVAQVGDLSFSLIKREFGIKDYGHLFLAHGGVLDRFDSVLFVTPVIEIILSFVK